MSKNKAKPRKLEHNVGTHKEKMAKRRKIQRSRFPTWAVILLQVFGVPTKEDRNHDFWEEREV